MLIEKLRNYKAAGLVVYLQGIEIIPPKIAAELSNFHAAETERIKLSALPKKDDAARARIAELERQISEIKAHLPRLIK
jgi:hypothetical protein